ncbi:MAG: PAS-domain containing protein [Pseudomonadota bacterium]
MFRHLGVRARLLLAFLGISTFAVTASIAGIYAFNRVAGFLDHIIQERVPLTTTSLEVSRSAERIASSASSYLAARTDRDREEVSAKIEADLAALKQRLADLKVQSNPSEISVGLDQTVFFLEGNLEALQRVVTKRQDAAKEREQILRKVSRATLGANRVIDPAIRVMDAKVAQWQKRDEEDLSLDLVNDVMASLPQQKAQVLVASINDTLIRAADARRQADLNLLSLPLDRNLDSLANLAEAFDVRMQKRFTKQLQAFRDLKATLANLKQSEFRLDQNGERLLAVNVTLSASLTRLADKVVANARQAIDDSRGEALDIQAFSSRVMIATAVLTLISSALITWLYVDRNLIKRVRALSDSMLAIADGNLRADLPPAKGHDEIARMASALTVFRDTAVEIEENNLREVATARQRLVDAIESLNEGFCLYDKDDRLVLFNERYRESFPGNNDIIKEGATFKDIAGAIAKSGLLPEAVGREKDWVDDRVHRHRNPPQETALSRRADGRWMQISERRTSEGGSVGTFTDVTELKRREEEIARTTDRLQLALSMEGVGIWDVDLVNGTVWWSREYADLMRRDPSVYIPTDTSWEEHLHPNEAKDTIAKVTAFLDSDDTVMRLPEHFIRGDGSEFWVESLMRVQRNDEGEAIRLSGLDVDISEQLEREHELERVSERLGLALSIDEVGIYDADLKANTLWWSPEYTAMLGHDPATFVPVPPMSWEERLHPDEADHVKERMEAFFLGHDDTMRLRQHMLRADQREIWIDSVMRVQRNDEGEATRLTGLAVDITDQLQREQQLTDANRFIMESLRYASRIQSAMLPAREAIGSATRDHFLIWEPRDIVGGDFFWHHPMHGGYAMIVGDCTGHGVPGAFMTLIACGLLDRMLQSGVDRPSLLLNHLHRELQTLLGQDQSEGETDDGLEAGICFVNDADKRLVFSGARFSLYHSKGETIDEIKGDKAGIGYRRYAAETAFHDVALDFDEQSAFYMTTDGLIDQIGGERRRSFGKRRFLACLSDRLDQPMSVQGEHLKETFASYQGDENRRDDVTVLGFIPRAS